MGAPTGPETPVRPRPGRRLARDVALYTLLRLVLFVLIAVVVMAVGAAVGVTVPLLVAGIIALVVALPVSMIAFTGLRSRINEGIAAVDTDRRERREDLRRRMNQR